MPEQYYKDALKQAQKEYRACITRGQYPYLPVMDDFIAPERYAAGIDLGLVQIPMEFIVGTRTRGRTNSFARNFMPLLSEKTEFAAKWEQLCQSHLEEGIRDPIKVYECMNRFYVEEGNKRVSVLKFFDAVSVSAQVTRIMPEQSADTELYYEFVAFYRYSKINFIEFTKKGSYASLQRLVGKAPEEPWTEDERNRFAGAYHYFREVYEANGGAKLASTVGDAMLAYLRIYGYQSLRSCSQAELKKAVSKMWEEVTLQQEASPIELKLDPGEEKKPGILSRVLPTTPKELKVAFLHDKTPEASGWTFAHELGREHVQRVFEGKINTTSYMNALEGDPMEVIDQAIADGNTVLFTTSPRLLPDSLHAAVDHPEITILNCSLNKSHRYIRTYYARMYEAKFIIGAIAGGLTEKDQVGYVCDYPIFGQIAGINAFALGAQMVNPRVKVYLEWSSVGGSKAATKRLTDRGIHLISSQDMAKMGAGSRSSFGLARVADDAQLLLAMPIWDWGVYYEGMLRRILDKTLQSEYESNSKALNYYWGMSAGVVDLYCTNAVPESLQKLVNYLKESICRNICNPFVAPLHLQDGSTITDSLTQEQIINMDYLVDNVVGAIPAYDELSYVGKATVDQVGVEPSAPRGLGGAEPGK